MVSSCFRLHSLCGLDPVQDMFVDAMHAICLNLIRTELEYHVLLDLRSNIGCSISDRSSTNGGLPDRKDLDFALSYVPWTTKLKNGRVPSVTACNDPNSKHRLGHWKSEELWKFALVAPFCSSYTDSKASLQVLLVTALYLQDGHLAHEDRRVESNGL